MDVQRTMPAVVVVRMMEPVSGTSRLLLRGRGGRSSAQILAATQNEVAQVMSMPSPILLVAPAPTGCDMMVKC